MKTEYEIGGNVYTRKELLEFGKRHYPKFYWIKRGIGIGLMVSFGIPALICVFEGLYYQQLVDPNDSWTRILPESMYWSAAILTIGLIIGIVLFAMSFSPLPDEAYIKHAVDYYTKQAANQKRAEVRQEARQAAYERRVEARQVASERREAPKDDFRMDAASVDALIKYKKLLDEGAITQEEYDAKKKTLL